MTRQRSTVRSEIKQRTVQMQGREFSKLLTYLPIKYSLSEAEAKAEAEEEAGAPPSPRLFKL